MKIAFGRFFLFHEIQTTNLGVGIPNKKNKYHEKTN